MEDELYKELQRNNESVKAQLLSFMFYVHDIIRNSELEVRQHNQGNTNYTRLLDRLQQHDVDEKMGISLVTFNYDTLLDTACSQLYPTWEFNDFDDYIKGISSVRLYKPHGSLSWKKTHTNSPNIPYRLSSIKGLLNPTAYGIFDHNEQIDHYYFEHVEHITRGDTITEPILALPYREKTSFAFPRNHIDALTRDMAKATHILTIGWRGEENHFQKEFLVNVLKGVKILNINKGGQNITVNMQRALGDKISSMQSFTDGFTAFLDNKILLEGFLKS